MIVLLSDSFTTSYIITAMAKRSGRQRKLSAKARASLSAGESLPVTPAKIVRAPPAKVARPAPKQDSGISVSFVRE